MSIRRTTATDDEAVVVGRPSVADAAVKIAEIFDSTDDDARLTLVTQYLGHKLVKRFHDWPVTTTERQRHGEYRNHGYG